MADVETDKAEKRSISFPPAVLRTAIEKADEQHGGNLSRYVQALVERDTGKGRGETPSPSMLEDLCRDLAGSYLRELRQYLDELPGVDQPTVLANLLLGLIGMARRLGGGPSLASMPVVIDMAEAGFITAIGQAGNLEDESAKFFMKQLSDSLTKVDLPIGNKSTIRRTPEQKPVPPKAKVIHHVETGASIARRKKYGHRKKRTPGATVPPEAKAS